MAKLPMGVYAGIAAGGVMFLLILLPVLGCLFSRDKKARKAVEQELAAEKGEVIYSVPVSAPMPAPTRPANAIIQKPIVHISQQESVSRSQSSTPSISPSYQSQASTLAPQVPPTNSSPSSPYMQPAWVRPSS
ncbi:hypothetical protein E8E13_011136 [Curvularia kusanoi]|uniref:Uncharacterized protein n=1 Tax=Curvularia kusanoi TaxID=90978 RepID=A0A9P4WEK7_CURKU|nr:hypothetical protein E8E13_011136 [Curvularia kusanoi]